MNNSNGRRLRAAVIGPGYIGAVHAGAIRRAGGDVDIIVGRPGSDLATRAASCRVGRFTERLEEVLGDPSIDVVHVCTPNALHYPIARAVLEHGKHLVCEKPLTTSLSEALELVRAAEAAGVVAGVAYCYRYYPLVAQARHLVARGTLGVVHQVRGTYLADELLHDSYLHYRFDTQIAGPSVSFFDVGVHWCDLAEHVLGRRMVEVFADMQTVVAHRTWREGAPGAGPRPASAGPDGSMAVQGEDCLTLLARFEGGARANVVVSQVSAGFKNRLTLSLDGSQAGLDWDQEQPNTLTVRRVAPSIEVVQRDPGLLCADAASLAHTPAGHPEGYLDAFYNLIDRIYRAIGDDSRTDSASYPTLADGARGIAIAEAALRSAASGRWEAVAKSPAHNE
jgi:predicted dehydrogenase